MASEENIRLAVISGASHALSYRKENENSSAEDAINSVSGDMNKILSKFGETNSPNNIVALAALAGASKAVNYADRNRRSSDKEALQHVSDNMEEIVNKLNTEV